MKSNKQKAKASRGQRVKESNGGGPVVAAAVAYASKQEFPKQGQLRSRRIQNSELVGSVLGSVSFTANRYAVNPGIAGTFPWLSVQAAQWQQYRFHKLHFRYVTRTATDEKGSVILSPDYNPVEVTPTTELQASNTQDAVEDVVWKELCCKLDPTAMFPFGPRKQVRISNVAGDQSVYDAARFYLCTVEEDSADAIGKLWVDYDVEFFVPQNSPSTASSSLRISEYTRAVNQSFTSAVAANLTFDTLIYDPLGVGAASGSFTPPAGTYLLEGVFAFADTSAETFSVSLEIQKNSASLTNPALSVFNISDLAGGVIQVPIRAIVTCNGADTIRLRTTLTGAAGTLTWNGAASRLHFSMA